MSYSNMQILYVATLIILILCCILRASWRVTTDDQENEEFWTSAIGKLSGNRFYSIIFLNNYKEKIISLDILRTQK